jgi:hypothetical protein
MENTKVFRILSTKGKTSIRNDFLRKSYNQICDKIYADKVAPIQAMKTLGGNSGTAPLIFIFVTRCKGIVSLTLRALYWREGTFLYPLNRRLSGPQNGSGPSGEEINLLLLL